jgi:hypothetical protein
MNLKTNVKSILTNVKYIKNGRTSENILSKIQTDCKKIVNGSCILFCSIMYGFKLVERSEELATRQRLRGLF